MVGGGANYGLTHTGDILETSRLLALSPEQLALSLDIRDCC